MARRRGAASELVGVVMGNSETKVHEESKSHVRAIQQVDGMPLIDKCGCCFSVNPIVYYDMDMNWELPGHPDHFNRPVCEGCVDTEWARNKLCVDVYAALRKKLSASEMAKRDIDDAVHAAWRTFNVSYDNDALLKMAKQLKVKTDWVPIKSGA